MAATKKKKDKEEVETPDETLDDGEEVEVIGKPEDAEPEEEPEEEAEEEAEEKPKAKKRKASNESPDYFPEFKRIDKEIRRLKKALLGSSSGDTLPLIVIMAVLVAGAVVTFVLPSFRKEQTNGG